MATLRALQQRLAAEILGGHGAAAPPSDEWRQLLRLPAGVDPDTRLAVYRDGYPARILDALRDAYPAIATICGDGSFAGLARRYLARRDLSRVALNDIGGELPEHLADDPLTAELPFLADLARLERQVLRSFHGRDLRPVDPALFAALDMDDWERAVLTLQPSAAIVRSPWPVRDLWQARDTPREEIDLPLADRPQAVLVHRLGYDVDCRLLDAAESIVLEALLSRAPLGRAMQTLAETAGADLDVDPSSMFAAWLAAGLITSVDLAEAG